MPTMSDVMHTLNTRTLPHPSGDANLRILVTDEPEPANPLDGHPVVVWCHHERYVLGTPNAPSIREVVETLDEGVALAEHLATDEGARVILPVYLHDHSGLSVRVGAPGASPFTGGGWDTSMVGYAFIPEANRDAGWGADGIDIAGEEEVIRAAVTEYDHYLAGRVYRVHVQERTLVRTHREVHHASGLVTHEHTTTYEWHDSEDDAGFGDLYGWDCDIDAVVAAEFATAPTN